LANEQEIIDCIQLINSENVGPITFFKLLEMFGTPGEALKNLNTFKKLNLFPRAKAELEFKRAQKDGVTILTCGDDAYPENLRAVEDRPPVIYALGNIDCLKHPLSLSIVGARNASVNGRKTASKIAHDLTCSQVMIISGMARGIDSAAHKGAMYANNQTGATIAVLGTGVDVPYPKENITLYDQIRQNGLIISEFPLGTQPQAANFPRRNRIVSALGLGTLVVEATLNSGSLITARLALEQGKDIFAIPGTPKEPRSAGPNKLIKDGAVLVESAEDILAVLCQNNRHMVHRQMEINFNNTLKKENPPASCPPVEKSDLPQTAKAKIIDYLDYDGVYVDEIIRTSGRDASVIAMELLELELNGKIIRQPGNKVALIK